jgi:hypothetical protein
VKLNEDGLCVNNFALKEESRILEHNDIFTLIERSFRYELTPEMLAKAQLASSHVVECVTGMIPLSMETPKKPSSLSASVFSISEVPSSPATPKTPVPALRVNSNSNNNSNGQSPRVAASPMGMVSNVVDNEITTSPKLSPKVFKLDGEVLGSVSSFNIIGASSLGMNVISSTDGNAECDKENAMPQVATIEEKPAEDENHITESVSETKVTAVSESVTVSEFVPEISVENVQSESIETVFEEVNVVCGTPVESGEATAEVCEAIDKAAVSFLESTETCEPSEIAAETVCEIVTIPVEEVIEGCAHNETKPVESSEIVESTEVSEATVDVVMSEVTAVTEVAGTVAEACQDVDMNESTTEVFKIAEVEPVAAAENSADISINVQSCDVEMETVGSSIEYSENCTVTESVLETDETVMDSAETYEVIETSESVAECVIEPVTEIVDCIMESIDEIETIESVLEVSEPVAEAPEIVEVEMSVSIAHENAVACEPVIEAKEEEADVTEYSEVTIQEIATVALALHSIENSALESSIENVGDEIITEEPAIAEIECVAPVETVIVSMSEVLNDSEAKSAESFVNAYETSSDYNSLMEGVELNEDASEMPAENVPKATEVTEFSKATEVVESVAETVTDSAIELPACESPADESVESTPVIAAEAEIVEESREIQNVSVDSTAKLAIEESILFGTHSAPVASEEQAQSHNEDNLEVSIDPIEEVVVEIHAGSQEIASVSIPVSPSRLKESDELATSTPGPQRKSTRVHVTPKALESVKKQETSGESGNKRILRSTGGRQLRSRVSAEPASPKGRNQKRGSGEGENVDPASLSLSVDNNTNKKKSKTESDNTPVRRSARSRIQK